MYPLFFFFFFSFVYTTSPAAVMKLVVFFRSSKPPCNFGDPQSFIHSLLHFIPTDKKLLPKPNTSENLFLDDLDSSKDSVQQDINYGPPYGTSVLLKSGVNSKLLGLQYNTGLFSINVV